MIVILFNFLIYFGLGIFLSYLLLFFLSTTPLLESQVTFIMSLVPILNLFSTNFFAYLSDRYQKHKLVLGASMMFTIIGLGGLYAVSFTGNIFLIITSYYILSFFMQAPMQLIENFTIVYASDNDIAYGKLRSFGSLGYALAGYLGGYLTHTFGLSIIFLIYALAFFIPLLFIKRLPTIDLPQEAKQEKGLYKKLFSIKEYNIILILSFLIIGSTASMATFFGVYIQNYAHLDLKFLGLTILISAGSEVPMMFISDKMIDKFGEYKVIMLASFLLFIRFLVYVFLPTKFWITLVSFTHGIGYGSTYTAMMNLIEKYIPADIRSVAISFNATFAVGFGTFIIISVSSFVLNAHSVFILLAIFELIAFVIAYFFNKKESNLHPTH